MKGIKQNPHEEVVIDGVACIEFVTGGKYKKKVIVDKKAWGEYINQYHWTAIKKGNRFEIKSSKDKLSVRLHRIIVEHEFLELDYWGTTIDHINGNPLDNRSINLRIYSSKLNSTNVQSKFSSDNRHMIHPQRNGKFKVHINVFDEVIYKNFGTLEEAQTWRDNVAIPMRDAKIEEMIKKTRDIEFERGLRDKIRNNEKMEVLEILKNYDILCSGD